MVQNLFLLRHGTHIAYRRREDVQLKHPKVPQHGLDFSVIYFILAGFDDNRISDCTTAGVFPRLHVKYRYGNFYNCPVRRKGISVTGR